MPMIETVCFIDDLYLADFYQAEIRRKNESAIINVYKDFDEYYDDRIIVDFGNKPFVSAAFYFYNLDELCRISSQKRSINFVVDTRIQNVRLDFVPLVGRELLFTRCREPLLVQYCFKGVNIRFDKSIRRNLFETAIMLCSHQKFYIPRNYINLKEFLEQFTSNIFRHFEAEVGSIVLYEKADGLQELFKRKFCKSYIEDFNVNHIPCSVHKLEVKPIDGIEDEMLKKKLKRLGLKHRILLPISSRYSHGHVDFFSKLSKISSVDLEFLAFAAKEAALFIDNAYFFRNMLPTGRASVSIFDDVQDGILVVDKNRLVVDINEACVDLTGWSRKDAIGKRCKLLWHSCDFYGSSICDTRKCPMLIPLTEKRSTSLTKIYTRDKAGKQRIMKSNYLLREDGLGHVEYGVAVVRDLTEHIELEEKLHRFEQLATLGKFAAELAHEIRNPITGISSSAQFLYEECSIEAPSREIAKEIVQGVKVIETVVRKYLDLGHPSEPHLIKSNINEVLERSLSILKKKMEWSSIEYTLSLRTNLPPILLDPDSIQQVFVNILMNSIEAIEKGGKIEIDTSMKIRKSRRYVSVKISDTGCGIPDEIMDRIFDPFFTTKPTGSGLGLYSAYRILQNHDASIEVRSRQDKGTETSICFRIT